MFDSMKVAVAGTLEEVEEIKFIGLRSIIREIGRTSGAQVTGPQN